MTVVRGVNVLKSPTIRKKFGYPTGYGQSVFGISPFGLFFEHGGIYQMRPRKNGAICVKEKFYWPTQQTEGPQEDSRQLFKGAVSTWQGFSEDQKNSLRAENPYPNMSGYNYFIKKFFEDFWS